MAKKSDLKKYVYKRKQTDPEFAENYDEGYQILLKKVLKLEEHVVELGNLKEEYGSTSQ